MSKKQTNTNGELVRERLAAAVPTAATTTRATSTRIIFQTVSQLMEVRNFEKILRVESRYRHISSFLNDPFSDAYVLYAFGTAKNMLDQKMKLAQNTRFIISKELKSAWRTSTPMISPIGKRK